MIFFFNLLNFPLTNEFCNKSQTPNKIPLIILSQKRAHCEHFPSLPFLLFNTLLAVFKVTDARRDVILTGGLNHRFPWRHLSSAPWLQLTCIIYVSDTHGERGGGATQHCFICLFISFCPKRYPFRLPSIEKCCLSNIPTNSLLLII